MARPESRLISELKPEIVKRIVRRRINEVRKPQLARKEALAASVEEGHIRFWLRPKTRSGECLIFILGKQGSSYCYFASAQENVRLQDVKDTYPPYDFLIREERSFDNPHDVAQSLAEFINQYFPYAADTPFSIYTSSKKISHTGNPSGEYRPAWQ